MNVFLTHPVVHCMNLYQTTQLQHSPQCRKSCTLCRFKCKVRVLIYLLRLHFCSGEVAQQQLLLTQHETHTKIMLCLWLSSCLHETKSHWESADIVSANQNKTLKTEGIAWSGFSFLLCLPFFLPSFLFLLVWFVLKLSPQHLEAETESELSLAQRQRGSAQGQWQNPKPSTWLSIAPWFWLVRKEIGAPVWLGKAQ